ncbi:MAG: HEAT repeat domain-containing protein, partial [Desulfobacteria bacterium]
IHCRRRDPLMTNLFLAARCLEEMVVVEKPTVEAKVIQSLVKEIEEDQFEGLKEKARRVLMHMGNSQRSMPVIKAIKKMLYRPPLRQEAAFMLIKLREIDEDVVKAILEMLRSTKQEERLKARYALNEIAHSAQSCDSVLQFLSSPEAKYRGTAALALGWLGINDGVMISKIIALLEDDNQSVRRRCAAALGWIGHASDDVIMALVRRLTLQEKTSVRRIAATALGELGDPREEVVNALLTLIREQEGDVCGTAASSLGWLGDDRPEVRDALLGLLDSPVEDVRGRAVLALGDLGVSEEAVTNRVAQLLNNEKSKEVQWRAASALAQVGQSSEIVVTALAARVRMGKVRVLSGATDKAEIRQKELVVKHASQALTWLNHGSGVVINILKELAERGTGNQRADAVAAIGRLGLVDQAILELMMRRIDEEKEKEEDVRGAAISALRRLRVADKGILVAITDSLETDSATSVKWRAAQALGVLGQPDQKTIGILKSKLNARETEIKLRAAEALINLGKGGKPAADALVSLLSNRNPSIAQHAVKVLRLLGQRSKSINDELLRVFQNATDTELKGEITTTFGALKCTKPEVITELVGTLSDADMELRAKSASTLSELARNEKEVIKSIAGLLATEDSALRRKAVMGLYLLLRGSQTGIQEMPSTDELELVDLLDSLMKDEAEIGHPLVGAQSRVKDVAWWVLQEYQRSYPIQYKQRYPAT